MAAIISGSAPASVTVRGNSSTDGNVTASGTILFNAAPTCNLDIDGDGAVLATTDGLPILRNLLQLTGTALVSGAYNPAGSYGNLPDMSNRLGVLNSNGWLDIDGNGTREAATDGVLLLRTLFGLTGSAVTNGALGSNRVRATTGLRSATISTRPAARPALSQDDNHEAPDRISPCAVARMVKLVYTADLKSAAFLHKGRVRVRPPFRHQTAGRRCFDSLAPSRTPCLRAA